jgi:mannose-6-phosphate isomerase
MKPSPLLLDPQFVHRIWGARSLAPLFPHMTSLPEPVGEVWLTGNNCRIASGAFAGRTLADAWRAMPAEYAGTRMDTKEPFPLLVKFLFPEDILSIQVHPGDDYVRLHEAHTGWTGKTEMWHVVAARPGAEVLVGLKPEITREGFRRAIADGTAEQCLERIPITAGDTIFVPAGTVHTIGPGSVLCEIQQNSDLTYRVFDYNRRDASGQPRELHIEKALAVARFGPQRGGKVGPLAGRERLGGSSLVSCPYFEVQRYAEEIPCDFEESASAESFHLIIFLEGAGAVSFPGGRLGFSQGQAWLMPAGLGGYRLDPARPSVLLRCRVPGP